MRRPIAIFTWLLILLALSSPAQEQRLSLSDGDIPDAVPHSGPSVHGYPRTPQLIKVTSALRDYMGRPMVGVHGVTFALYRDQQGGSPIWIETTSVEFDEQGRFTALLGAASERGLTPELFASGEPRWLGVQLQLPGWQEEPRTLMVAVPYALRALDADTLGGHPASAYVLAETSNAASGRSEQSDSPSSATRVPELPAPLFVQTGNYLQKCTTTGDPCPLTDSLIYDNGTNIGIGTTNPTFKLSVSSAAVWNNDGSGTFAILDSADGNKKLFAGIDPNLGTYGSAFIQAVRSLTANIPILLNPSGGNVGIGTTSPLYQLDVKQTGSVGGLIVGNAYTNNSIKFHNAAQGTLGAYVDAAGGVSSVYNGLWLESNAAGFNLQSNSALPSWALDVGGRDTITFGGASDAFRIARKPSGGGYSEFLRVASNGNVGIGTSAPAHKLDVAGGSIRVKDIGYGIIFPDGTVQTTAAGSLAFNAPDDVKLFIHRQQQQIERLQAEILELRATFEQFRAASAR